MPDIYADLLSDDVWEPLVVSAADRNFYWADGGFLSAAPVDVAATFDGAMWTSDVLDPAFGMRARRISPGFTVPLRHHSRRQLMIVVDGELVVDHVQGDRTARVAATEFWVCEAGTAYTMSGGPQGATYVECWDGPMSIVETLWHDDVNWVRK